MKLGRQLKLLNLELTLNAAQLGTRAKEMKNGIISTVRKLAWELRLEASEDLFCFFSPHVAAIPGMHPRPYGFKFVIPKTGQKFDPGKVKAVFWIKNRARIIASTTCTTFFTRDGSAFIADDDVIPPFLVAKELSVHLRTGEEMSYCIGGPVNYVEEQVLPLLKAA